MVLRALQVLGALQLLRAGLTPCEQSSVALRLCSVSAVSGSFQLHACWKPWPEIPVTLMSTPERKNKQSNVAD